MSEWDEFKHGFWGVQMRDRMLATYSFAPFLEEAAVLLFCAHDAWHEWSVGRRGELNSIVSTLKDRARDFRQHGLGWASKVSGFGMDPSHILSASVFRRYLSNDKYKKKIVCPEAANYWVSAAVELLFILLPAFRMAEEEFYEEEGISQWLSGIIEKLMESPCRGSVSQFDEAAMQSIRRQAVLLECEGLAYMQATIEDRFWRDSSTSKKRKKKSELSDEEISRLADELGVSFEILKETFETEYSSWWEVAKGYRNRAEAENEIFISFLPADEKVREVLKTTWDFGMVTDDTNQKCWVEEELANSEQVIKMFISMFLSRQRISSNMATGNRRRIQASSVAK